MAGFLNFNPETRPYLASIFHGVSWAIYFLLGVGILLLTAAALMAVAYDPWPLLRDGLGSAAFALFLVVAVFVTYHHQTDRHWPYSSFIEWRRMLPTTLSAYLSFHFEVWTERAMRCGVLVGTCYVFRLAGSLSPVLMGSAVFFLLLLPLFLAYRRVHERKWQRPRRSAISEPLRGHRVLTLAEAQERLRLAAENRAARKRSAPTSITSSSALASETTP